MTLALAAAGHPVTGVDPARASFDAARAKPGAERVTWLEGTSRSLPTAEFDVATMTAHVAHSSSRTRTGGRRWTTCTGASSPVARGLDSRDPRAREWERWNPRESRQTVGLADGSTVELWADVTSVQDSTVTFEQHYVFADGEPLVSTAALRFRGAAELEGSLTRAGLVVEHIYGGWDREPVGSGDGELLVVARRPPKS